ncbi:hypothetical protein H0H93_008117 [Arthromyces matolae]|nr:hypothetical protein H0H93_008117 [Arthromyces matolae]
MPDSLPTTCSQKIVSHSSLPHDTLNLLSHNTQTLMESSPAAKTRPTEKSTLMTISHPNNPYVPWTPEIRRNIIRPIAVPTLCKQFGLPNSDKAEFSWDKPARTRLKLPTTLKNLSNSINKNFKQVVRRISRQKNESKPDMLDTSHCYHHYMSTNSFESSDTSTLHTWLSNRQRTEKLPSKEMTLDEYEERGSWLDLPQPSLTDAVVHGAFPTIQRTKCTQSDPPLRTCSQHDSSPCHWASEGVLSLQLDEHDLPCTFARTRELSMPGGWTFG